MEDKLRVAQFLRRRKETVSRRESSSHLAGDEERLFLDVFGDAPPLLQHDDPGRGLITAFVPRDGRVAEIHFLHRRCTHTEEVETGRFDFTAESDVRTSRRRRQMRRCGASEKHAGGHATTGCCACEGESGGTAANVNFCNHSPGVSASPCCQLFAPFLSSCLGKK